MPECGFEAAGRRPDILYGLAAVSVPGRFHQGIIIALAVGMNTIGFRLDEHKKARALASGGVPYAECGPQWASFMLFRDDWPKVDIEFWARKAYVAARELEP